MSKYVVKNICPVHKTAFCICYNCTSDLFCLEGAVLCPYCDISKFVTPRYVRETILNILEEFDIVE